MHIKAVIFDFDDTLLATFEQRSSLLIKVGLEFGYHVDIKQIKLNWGRPFYDLINAIMPNINYQHFYEQYSSAMLSSYPKMQVGVEPFLDFLKKHNISTVIVSSSSRDLVLQDLTSVNLQHSIDFVWGFEDTLFHKPDPRSLEQALSYLKRNGISSNESISIGDSPNDYIAAKDNGVTFFAVTTGNDDMNSFVSSGLSQEFIYLNLQQMLSEGSVFRSLIEKE